MKYIFIIVFITFPAILFGQDINNDFSIWEDIINSKIFNTVLQLLIGGLVLKYWSDRRSNKEVKKKEKLIFLNDTSNALNKSISTTFKAIRNKDKNNGLSTSLINELNEYNRHLFEQRFSVNIKSKVYIKDKDFIKKYELLMWQLTKIKFHLVNETNTGSCYGYASDINDNTDSIKEEDNSKIIEDKIRAKIEILSQKWPITNEKTNHKEKINHKRTSELLTWNKMIYKRAIILLSKTLDE